MSLFKGKRRKGGGQDVRIFFASDIHGSELCFKKFINAGKFYAADLLMLGGDITGKAMVPIIREADDRFRLQFMGAERVVDAAGLAEIEESIRFNGYYPYVCEPDEIEQMLNSTTDVSRAFTSVMREQVEAWIHLADERLEGSGIRCLIMPGNDDEPFLEEILAKSTTVENHDGAMLEVDDYLVVGYGWSNPTPWDTPREKPEDIIDSELRKLLSDVPSGSHLVFNPHVPPYNSGLDLAPELRPDFSMVTNGGQPHLIPVGSSAVRDVVQDFEPMLVLSGHIHESRGIAKVGPSVAINPGSEYNAGRLLGALIDLEGGTVKRQQLVVG